MAGRLQINRLYLASPARSYEVQFHPGVNLISGPITTGKSSILELIDYALGASNAPGYEELSKCSDVLLELEVGGELLTFQRNLKAPTAKALLYECSLDEVLKGGQPYEELAPKHVKSSPSISLAVLERLGIGEFQVKRAPTQEASETNSFSLRDLLRLMYINQDRMGAKVSFFETDPARAIKWRAGFEIVHDIFDATAAGLADALHAALRQEQDLIRHFASVRKFLDQFKVPTIDALDLEDKRITEDITKAKALQEQQRIAERASLGTSHQLAERRNALADSVRTIRARSEELGRSARQLGRLRVQYERELKQWEFLKESQVIMGSIPITRCPACFQGVAVTHDDSHCHLCKQELQKQPEDVPVENRIRAVRRRIADLMAFLEDLKTEAQKLDEQSALLDKEVAELDQTLHRIRRSTLLDETRAIIETNETIGLLEKSLQRVHEQLAYRRRAQGEGSNLAAVQQRIENLRKEIKLAEDTQLSPVDVTKDLSAWYQALLADIKFPALRDAFVDDKSYLPFVRNQPYPELSSKGAISLAVVVWHLGLLEYALKTNSRSRYPRLLMLDSPLSHVGRGSDDPEFRDQKIVDAFYALLTKLHARANEFQIIMVDNRPPPAGKKFIAVEFTGDPSHGRYGLIDDEHPPLTADAGGTPG